MAIVTLEGKEIHTNGRLPAIGSQAPAFHLTHGDLSDASLNDYPGKKLLLNIVPSLDTGTCAESARRFNQSFATRADAVALTVSADLPFAQDRFCSTEGLDNVIPLSMMKDKAFAEDYGVLMVDGPLQGLASRAVVIIDEFGKISYTQLVAEIVDEPDYQAALAALDA